MVEYTSSIICKERGVNRKERAINLGLKIKSLEGNLSVAKSVIQDLELEIQNAIIDEDDREHLINLYNNVIQELKGLISPSVEIRNRVNQVIEDLNCELKTARSYSELLKLEGRISNLPELLDNNKLKKEHRAPLRNKIQKLNEIYNKKVGQKLQRNFEKLQKDIEKKCSQENPFHVSISIKELNKTIQITPLFNKDRHKLQAILDTNWQKSSRDIKIIKEKEES